MLSGRQLPPDTRHHGTSSAIEYAVRGLGVEHVVVLGHALCGGIAALVEGKSGPFAGFDYLSTWTRPTPRQKAVGMPRGSCRTYSTRMFGNAYGVSAAPSIVSPSSPF